MIYKPSFVNCEFYRAFSFSLNRSFHQANVNRLYRSKPMWVYLNTGVIQ